MQQCDLTIITITLNNFAALTETYHSIINSKVYPKEWIIIDGDSTDETKSFFASLHVPGIDYTFSSEKDAGIYFAMNKGIALAKCNYLLFLNAGDILNEYSLPSVIKGPLQLKFVTNDYFGRERKWMMPEWYGIPAPHQAFIFPNITADRIFYDTQYRYAADYDFYMRYRKSGFHFEKIDSGQVTYHRGGFSDGNYQLAIYEKNKVVKTYFGYGVYFFVKLLDAGKIFLKKLLQHKSPYVAKNK